MNYVKIKINNLIEFHDLILQIMYLGYKTNFFIQDQYQNTSHFVEHFEVTYYLGANGIFARLHILDQDMMYDKRIKEVLLEYLI